jgi:hypothetical protein
MTLSTAGYTVGANLPLNHARILWAPITGTVTADGTDGALAANEFTFQRWEAAAGFSAWTLTTASTVALDTVFIAAHNLTGKTFRSQVGGASRTNLALRSQEFDNAAWGKANCTVTANATTAPDGTLTADTMVENTAVSVQHWIIPAPFPIVAGDQVTVSIYLKPAGRFRADIAVFAGSNGFGMRVNLNTQSIVTQSILGTALFSSGSIEALPNGWFRVSFTGYGAPADTSLNFIMYLEDAAGLSGYTGDGVSGMHVWGAQFEVGSGSTSYIPTTSAAVASDWHDIHSWITPTDSSAIAIMTNNAGVPWSTGKLRILISDGDGVEIGIIRAGVALQMQQPVFGGVNPVGLNRLIETRHSMSETGQWLGRTIQRQALRTTMDWQHLEAAWYRASFEPFARTLPQRPFGLIQNPLRMPESVAWCWTDESPAPQNMGLRDLMSVSLNITGFLE